MITRVHHHDEGYLFKKNNKKNAKPFFLNDIDNQFQALPSPR